MPWAQITLAMVLVITTGACAFPEEAFDVSLEGTYSINGFDHRGNEYGGTLIITPTDDSEVFELEWIITAAIQTGVGTLSDDELQVRWEAVAGFDTSSQGTAVYQIGEDGKLVGERTVDGQDGVGTEEAFPVVSE